MHPYLPQTGADREAMLKTMGASSVDELFAGIPADLKLSKPLNLPAALSEPELFTRFHDLSVKNRNIRQVCSYLGAGAYEHYQPSVVRHLLGRSEFYTAYTPYQPEMTQGMLQAIFEYQSSICLLTGMDVSNASLYEGGHALAEAVLMACHATSRKRIVLGAGIHPEYVEVLRTYLSPTGVSLVQAGQGADGATDIKSLESCVDSETAGVVMANPNFFGCLENGLIFSGLAHAKGALLVACCEPVSLGLLAAPGEYGADIACGEGQALGIPLSFGGPYLGYIACSQALVRRMPGRLVGQTRDNRGQRGFVLTLQTREQHIRREKATSNICSNEALMALAATIYLAALGPEGLKEVADLSLRKAHYLANELSKLPGVALAYSGSYFCEFTLRLPKPAVEVLAAMQAKNILAGVPLSRFFKERDKEILVAITETKTKIQLDAYVAAMREALAGKGEAA